MDKKTKKLMEAEYRALTILFKAILSKPVKIYDVKDPDDLGYTMAGMPVSIYIAWEHSFYKKLSEVEKRIMRKGIGAHELGHQLFTPFAYEKKVLDKLPKEERDLFHGFYNAGEDVAEEYLLLKTIKGALRKSLLFTIKHIYDNTPALDEKKRSSALSEYMSAMIMFGDIGLIKGQFQYPEAKRAFYETAESFFKATRCPNGIKRVDMFLEIFKSIEYLWRETADNEKKLQEFMDMLRDAGVTNTSGNGNGTTPDIDPDDLSEADKRAIATISAIKKSMSSGNDGDDSAGSGSASGSSSDEENNDDDGKGGSASGKEGEDNSDDKNGSGSGSGNKEDDKDNSESASKNNGEDKNNSSTPDGADGNSDKKSSSENGTNDNPPSNDGTPAEGECGEGFLSHTSIDWDEYMLTEEEIENISKEINREIIEYNKEVASDEADTSPLMSSDDIHQIGSCLNTRVSVSGDCETAYSTIVAQMSPEINKTVRTLKDIFAADKERKVNTSSGKLNTRKLYIDGDYITRSGTITPNVFRRRIKPDEKNDFAVAIAIDESGSMGAYCSNGKRRSELARETVIAFAEIFNKLNIPIYIMGFSADEKGYDTTHYHYVTWKNTKMDRYSLLNITNRCDNRDGPSIRYLTKILDEKEAKHKLLIVISDGAPAAHHYENGDADTAKAVRDAARKFPVFGVSIGNANEELLASFYKQHFIVVKQGEDLFAPLAKKLKKLLK